MKKFWHHIYWRVAGAILLILWVIGAWSEYQDLATLIEQFPDFAWVNYDSGTYDHSLILLASPDWHLPTWASLRYTLDGQDPTWASPRLWHPLYLKTPKTGVSVYPLKISLCYPDHDCRGLVARTYVLGRELKTDLDVDIISLTSDNRHLYDEHTGILVAGAQYEANPLINTPNYRQRDEDWIRPAHITYINTDGTVVWQQPVGIQVSGDTSASYEVKSLKIQANKKYGYQPLPFCYLPSGAVSSRPIATEYNSLRLRSGAQDIFNGNIRSSVASQLLAQTDITGHSHTRRAIVYLNGHYYGIFEIQENYSDSWLAKNYALPDNEHIEKVKGSEKEVWTQLGFTVDFDQDLNYPPARDVLEHKIDMDDYLRYYTAHILLNDIDWPHKNYEVWRWTGEPDPDNPYTDGRWRFLHYDADYIYSTDTILIYGNEQTTTAAPDTLENLLIKLPALQYSSFAQVMTSDYYRHRFLQLLADWQVTPFSPENVNTVIQDNAKQIEHQQYLHRYDHWDSDFYGGVEKMLAISSTSSARLDADVDKYWGLRNKYTLELTTDEYTSVSWLGRDIGPGQTYRAQYWIGTEATMTAKTTLAGQFAGWTVDGHTLDSATLTISDELSRNHHLTVQAHSVPPEEKLYLSNIAARDADWLTITNIGQKPARLNDYTLAKSDATSSEHYSLPSVTLEPGASMTLNGKNTFGQLGEGRVNFSWHAGNTLYLYHADELVDQVTIPPLDAGVHLSRDRLGQISYVRD